MLLVLKFKVNVCTNQALGNKGGTGARAHPIFKAINSITAIFE